MSFLGDALKNIERPAGCRLQCTNNLVMKKCTSLLETFCRAHKIRQQVYSIMRVPHENKKILKSQLGVIDWVLGEGMMHAEKNVVNCELRKYHLANN